MCSVTTLLLPAARLAALVLATSTGCADPAELPPNAAEAGAAGGPSNADRDCELSYSEGHADLFVVFDAGELSWKIRSSFDLGAPETLVDPSEVCVVVPAASYALAQSMGGAPATEDFAFLGVPAGQAFWLLPQSPREGMPWLGASTEDVPVAVYDDDAIELTITAAGVPFGGALAAFSSGTFGAPSVIFATAIGKLAHSFRVGAHVHFNWVFTVAGSYELSFVVGAKRAGLRESSAPNRIRFLVEP